MSPLVEKLAMRWFFPTATVAVGGVVALFALVGWRDLFSLEDVSKFVDTTIKAVLLVVGAMWSLNRHCTERVDAPQLRIDADVSSLPAAAFEGSPSGLLVVRLDVVNTGKRLIDAYENRLEIHRVDPGGEGPTSQKLHEWPLRAADDRAWHDGPPIEPGSWAAVNEAIALSDDVRAVRVFFEIQPKEGGRHRDGWTGWTWHKTLLLPADVSPRRGPRSEA